VIENLRHVTPDANCQDQSRAELDEPLPHPPVNAFQCHVDREVVTATILAVVASREPKVRMASLVLRDRRKHRSETAS
jgi:hypothetical protein